MKTFWPRALVLLLLTACGGGGGSSPPPPAPPPPPSSTAAENLATDLAGLALDDLYEVSYAALLSRTPETIVWQALESDFPLSEVGLNNLSDAYLRETFAMHQVTLDALLTYDRTTLTPDDQLSYDVYQWYLEDTVDRLEFIYYDFIATYNFAGLNRETQQFFTAAHPMETEQDARDYIARLTAVPLKFGQAANYLTRQQNAGVIEPALTLDVAVNYMSEIANAAAVNTPFYTNFRDKLAAIPGIDAATRQSLLDDASAAISSSVIPAYQQLRQTMQNLLAVAPLSIGVRQYPLGPEFYDYVLKHRTTTDLSAAEIHQLGLDELQRIHNDMRLVFDQLGYPQNETLVELFARVEADGGVIPAANVRATYESIIAAAELELDQAFDVFPTASVVVAEDDFGGYYIGPSFDGTRPGAFYAGTVNDEAWYRMPSLTYHESIPGHHTQIAIAMEQDVPAFRKLFRFTAFAEGWALYAERLAYELGWYDNDPYGNLGRLQYEALRAARLVMDTGIHSLGWSFEQATQFNMDNVGWSRGASEGAAGRYSVVPAQATAYMVGMLKILEVRQRAMDELGPAFDLTEFHRVVLTSGAMPLALLDTVADQYIADKLAAP